MATRRTAALFQGSASSSPIHAFLRHSSSPVSPESSCRNGCLKTFSTSTPTHSKIGQRLLTFPADVKISVLNGPETALPDEGTDSRTILVTGPKGEISFPLQPFVSVRTLPIEGSTSKRLQLSVLDPKSRPQKAMWGTTNSILSSMITGVTEGFSLTLRLVGVGYRASIATNPSTGAPAVDLKLGYSHPVLVDIPPGVTCTVITPQRLRLQGIDVQKVTQFAAQIRKWRPPEPYNQKGVFVGDETIAKKEGKKK
ncbi:ribosomal protein L6 [Gonapodya prolifera JEL478]|uniref:Ribosomal protein L6 n=1 Tax=Gonapodya prolifera (strain JEL478) TaxID=1344416 RepID=A0A139AKJ2_GONPJ|nr:ribosomal protein L6 [Gonapodya prolifera JEL478]|eukprot:KXS16945.1 ribosomal protein L6 [Gonapodya prolifera JEL478]